MTEESRGVGSFADRLAFFRQLEGGKTEKSGPKDEGKGVTNESSTIGGVRHTTTKSPPPRAGGIRDKNFPAGEIIKQMPSSESHSIEAHVTQIKSPPTKSDSPDHIEEETHPPQPEIHPEEHPSVQEEKAIQGTGVEASLDHTSEGIKSLQSGIQALIKDLRDSGQNEKTQHLETAAKLIDTASDKYENGDIRGARRDLLHAQKMIDKEASEAPPEMQQKFQELGDKFSQDYIAFLSSRDRSSSSDSSESIGKGQEVSSKTDQEPPKAPEKRPRLTRQTGFYGVQVKFQDDPEGFVKEISKVARQSIHPVVHPPQEGPVSDKAEIRPGEMKHVEAKEKKEGTSASKKFDATVKDVKEEISSTLDKCKNKNQANEDSLAKLTGKQAELAKGSEQLSEAFKELKTIENVQALLKAKPPVLSKEGKKAALEFLAQHGAVKTKGFSKGKHIPMGLKFTGEKFELAPQKSIKEAEAKATVEHAYKLIVDTSKNVPAVKLHLYDLGRKELPKSVIDADPGLKEKEYKEAGVSWGNPSTIGGSLSRSEFFKKHVTQEHEALVAKSQNIDAQGRFAGTEAPAALRIVNHPANDAIVRLIMGHLKSQEVPDTDLSRDVQAIKNKGVRENFGKTIQEGLDEFQKELDQQQKAKFTQFSQAMADGNREQFVNIMRSGIDALSSRLAPDDPKRADLKKMRDEIKEIAGGRSWERVGECWDAFAKMVEAQEALM